MKIKKAAIITAVAVVILGVGAWAFFSSQSTPSSDPSKQQDTVAPTIKLNIPNSSLELAKTSKILEVSVETSDNAIVERVEYLIDGKVVVRTIESPFKASIDISNLAKGEHTLQAIAYDASGNSGKSKLFTFTIEGDDAVQPANDESQALVDGSSAITKKKSSGVVVANSSGGSSNSGDQGDSGGDGDGNPPTDPELRTSGGWYAALPSTMQICTSNVWNGGPATAPAGAITVPVGNNNGFNFTQANKTFWFAPGEHTLGAGQFAAITPGDNSTYIGAPGAILDGKNANQYAFQDHAVNVRIAYLEVRNFGRGTDNNNEGVINHNAGDGWTMEYLYAHGNDGAAIFLGSQNTVRHNCLKDNGQYGFSMYKPEADGDSAIKDIVVDYNEISGNNQDDWETNEPGCGCTGGGKFWDVKGARVTNNYVHDNLSTGLWADTNDIDFLFDSNWIEHNSGEGIWYEISYNATMSRNVIKRNAWASGIKNTGSPAPAIYISESGGDSRLQSSTSGSTSLQIKNNLLQDNFSGVSIYESSNRFCNSNGNTSKVYCTPFVSPTIIPPPYNTTYPNPINSTHPCYTNIASAPYTNNCRWQSRNVQVFNNEFRFQEANVPCTGTYCGVQALFATGENNISWAPAAYDITTVQNNVMFNNNNKFYNNTYHGNWRFAKKYGNEYLYFGAWQAAPFLQDGGSTFDGLLSPPPTDNSLNADTATLEGGLGKWESWYSSNVSQSTAEAHTGTHSLLVDVTSGGGWGAQLSNHPGFLSGPGHKRVSFWAKQGSGAISTATLRIKWFDSDGILLQTDTVPLASLSTSWQKGTADITAPANTNNVFAEFYSGSGSTGNSLYADDFIVADIP